MNPNLRASLSFIKFIATNAEIAIEMINKCVIFSDTVSFIANKYHLLLVKGLTPSITSYHSFLYKRSINKFCGVNKIRCSSNVVS